MLFLTPVILSPLTALFLRRACREMYYLWKTVQKEGKEVGTMNKELVTWIMRTNF